MGMNELIEMEYLTRTGSDHSPLLNYSNQSTTIGRHFSFLKLLADHTDFQDVARAN